MSRTLDNYLQNLINKSTAQFQNALTPLVNQQLERQQQEWEDKRKGGQIADMFNARQQKKQAASGLFDKAQENYNIASSIRDYAQSTMPLKSTDEILKDLSTPKTSFFDQNYMTNNEHAPSGSFLNKFKVSFNMPNAVNDYKINYGTDTKPQTFEEYNTNFWNEQIDTLKRLRSDFQDYEYNPLDSIEKFKENPLTVNQHNIYEFAKNGNMIAANELYNELYPDKQFKTRSYISPDGKSKVNEELLYYISPDGTYNEEIIKETASPYISEKDLLDYKHRQNMALADYKHNKDMEKAKFQAAAKGSKEKENLAYNGTEKYTPSQLNTFFVEHKIYDPKQRQLIIDENNRTGIRGANTVYKFNPNLKPVKYKDYFIFDNKDEYERNNKDLNFSATAKDYYITEYGDSYAFEFPINEKDYKYADLNGFNIEIDKRNPNMLILTDKDNTISTIISLRDYRNNYNNTGVSISK